MNDFEVSTPGGLVFVRDFLHPVDCGSGLKGIVRIIMESSSVDDAQETEGDHDDDDGLIEAVIFQDQSINGVTARIVLIKISDTPTNGHEATVRWSWNGISFEVKVKYTGP